MLYLSANFGVQSCCCCCCFFLTILGYYLKNHWTQWLVQLNQWQYLKLAQFFRTWNPLSSAELKLLAKRAGSVSAQGLPQAQGVVDTVLLHLGTLEPGLAIQSLSGYFYQCKIYWDTWLPSLMQILKVLLL